jgi:GntR family transcriptional regulator/MocR family aminotransferase
MRKASLLTDLFLGNLVDDPRLPRNQQLYRAIQQSILLGQLGAGQQLPPSRSLAEKLGIARNTVLYAYERLSAEGYVHANTGSGTYVADTLPDRAPPARKPPAPARLGETTGPALSRRGSALIARPGASEIQSGAFVPGVPDVAHFPAKIWQRLQNKFWRLGRADLLTYATSAGYLPLKQVLAEYLHVVRAVNCRPEQVIVTAGIHQSLDLCARMLADAGDRVWLEDPCYWGARNVLQAAGLRIEPIRVDDEGLDPGERDWRIMPRLIFVTPSHQYPIGAVMSLVRRRALLEHAGQHDCWVLEDDYDSEFCYERLALPSLQGLDGRERVIYMGTFSKVMYPGLRLGYVVVPEPLVRPFSVGVSELYRGGQLIIQAALTEFIAEGHLAVHVRRMRTIYAERQAVMCTALRQELGDHIALRGGDAGMHMIVTLPKTCRDVAIGQEALKQDIIARPLSQYYYHQARGLPGLVLGYGSVRTGDVKTASERLARVVQHALRALPPGEAHPRIAGSRNTRRLRVT